MDLGKASFSIKEEAEEPTSVPEHESEGETYEKSTEETYSRTNRFWIIFHYSDCFDFYFDWSNLFLI